MTSSMVNCLVPKHLQCSFQHWKNDPETAIYVTVAENPEHGLALLKNASVISFGTKPQGMTKLMFLPSPKLEEPPNDAFGVCVKHLRHNYSEMFKIVDFLEYYRAMGAKQVMMYDDSVSEAVGCILQEYVDEVCSFTASWQGW